MKKKIIFSVFLFLVIFIGLRIRQSMPEVIIVSTTKWVEVQKPLSIRGVRPDLKFVLVTNKVYTNPIIMPSPSGKDIELGNGIWVVDIALLPGQGVIEKAKVLVTRIKEE